MKIRILILCVIIGGCGSASDPLSPMPVPAGVSDKSWADVGKTCTPSSPVLSVSRARLDSAPGTTHGPGNTVDDIWSDFAAHNPGGFAGIILENGAPVVFLVDTTKKAQVFAAMQSQGIYSGNLSGGQARPARWSFTQLAEWFRYFQLNVYSISGLTFADIDESKNRISYGVRDSTSRVALEQILKRADVPCYLVGIQLFAGAMVGDRQH